LNCFSIGYKRPVRPVSPVFKANPCLSLSLSKTVPLFISLSSTNRTRFQAPPHGDLRSPPWNPCSKLGFGALIRGKVSPILSIQIAHGFPTGETEALNRSCVLVLLIGIGLWEVAPQSSSSFKAAPHRSQKAPRSFKVYLWSSFSIYFVGQNF
jgi:hypothetical protein